MAGLYHFDARTDPLECENSPQCPVCDGIWIGIRAMEADPVADCVNGHTFQVSTIDTGGGKSPRFTIGDQIVL